MVAWDFSLCWKILVMGFKSAKTYYIFIGLFKTYPTPKLKIKNIVLQIPHIFNKEI